MADKDLRINEQIRVREVRLIDDKGEPRATRIFGPVARELRERNYISQAEFEAIMARLERSCRTESILALPPVTHSTRVHPSDCCGGPDPAR